MTLHSPQKFGVSSLIDQLRAISSSFHPIVEPEDSFTFQCLPENIQSRKINKLPYLENEVQTSIIPDKKEEDQEQVGSLAQEEMNYFENVQDFQNRKSQVLDVQKKFLSVISLQKAATRLREPKKRIFRNRPEYGISTPVSYTQNSPVVKQNWLRQKQQFLGAVLEQFKMAALQCYAHTPGQLAPVQRQEARKENPKQ